VERKVTKPQGYANSTLNFQGYPTSADIVVPYNSTAASATYISSPCL